MNMPLTFASKGQVHYIKAIKGKDDVRRHLAGLGFVEGESVTVISEVGETSYSALKTLVSLSIRVSLTES